MSSKTTKPAGEGPASSPVAGPAARFGRSVLLVGLLAVSGAMLPVFLHAQQVRPWMASVTLTVHDMAGNPLPDTLARSVRDVTSEESLGRAVDLLGLEKDSEFAGGEASWLTVAFEILSGAEDGATDPRHRAIRALSRHIFLERTADGGDARLLVKASSPDKAMKIAEALATVYSAASEITGAVPPRDSMADVERAETALAEFRTAVGSAKLSDVLVKRSRLKGLDDHRASMISDGSGAAGLKDATVNDIISGRLGDAVSDDQLTALGKAYADASMQLSALSVSLGPKHPRLLQAQAEVEKSRAAVQGRLKLLKARVAEQTKTAQQMLAKLDAQRKQLQDEIAASGIDLPRYDGLVAALEVARERARAPAASERANLPVYDASAPKPLEAEGAALSLLQVTGGGLAGLGAALAFLFSRRGQAEQRPARKKKPAPVEPRLSAAVEKGRQPSKPRMTPTDMPKPLERSHSAANRTDGPVVTDWIDPPHRAPLSNVSVLPTVEKLRMVAPLLFEEEQEQQEVERLREELAELRRRVLVTAGRRI